MSTGNATKTDWMGPREWVVQKIQAETGRAPVDAELLARQLEKLPADLRSALLDWWNTGQVDRNLAVEGWSIQRIIERGSSDHVVEAFSWLCALKRNPEHTLKMLSADRCVVRVSEEDRQAGIKKKAH